MNIETLGYTYGAQNVNDKAKFQIINFSHVEEDKEGTPAIIADGTSEDELIDVLVSKCAATIANNPEQHNAEYAKVIEHLVTAKRWLHAF